MFESYSIGKNVICKYKRKDPSVKDGFDSCRCLPLAGRGLFPEAVVPTLEGGALRAADGFGGEGHCQGGWVCWNSEVLVADRAFLRDHRDRWRRLVQLENGTVEVFSEYLGKPEFGEGGPLARASVATS